MYAKPLLASLVAALCSSPSKSVMVHKMPAVSLLLLLALLVSAGSLKAEVYQWTDSRGVIHFTDSLEAVPKPIRGLPQLIVRKDFDRKEKNATIQRNSEMVVPEPLPETTLPVDTKPAVTESMDASPSVIHYSPQQVNIIVVNVQRIHPKNRPCPLPQRCNGVFRPNVNDRRFIHPSVFNGGSNQFIQPRLFSRPRK